MSKWFISFATVLLFSLTPLMAFADQQDSLTAGVVGEDNVEISQNGVFVSFENHMSTIKISNAVNNLNKNNINVESVKKFDHDVFEVEVNSSIETSVNEVRDIIENSSNKAHTTPVKKYKIQANKSNNKDKDHVYQTEYLGLFNQSDSVNSFNTGHGFQNVHNMLIGTNNKMTVAVIDSGFRETHKELQGKLIKKLAYDAVADKVGVIGKDAADHGTGIASIIVANKGNGVGGYGICNNTKILPIKAANDEGVFDEGDILKSLQYVEKLVASKKVSNLKVVNCSFGGHYTTREAKELGMNNIKSDPVYVEMKRLHDKYGILCVCAGGNGPGEEDEVYNGEEYAYFNYEKGFNFPSDYSCAVAVHGSSITLMSTSYADVNKYKDITANTDAEMASSKSDTSISAEEGTSISAAYVSSAIVSLMQLKPSITPDKALKLLKKTCAKQNKYNDDNYSKNNGSSGVMNVDRAAYELVGKNKGYWNGMTDLVKVNGVEYGAHVLNSNKKTAAISYIVSHNKKKNFKFPSKLRLHDGRVYNIIKIANTEFRLDNLADTITIPSSCSKLGENSVVSSWWYSYSNHNKFTKSLVIKSKKLTKKSVKNFISFNNLKLDKVVINVSKDHKVNLEYLKRYKKIMGRDNIKAKINKFVAA